MKYTKTFLILTALFGGLQSSLTYADNTTSSKEQKMTIESKQEQRIIYLAGGCFWGLEAYMERIQGVTDAVRVMLMEKVIPLTTNYCMRQIMQKP